MSAHLWQVRYHRQGWRTDPRSRLFSREHDARAFVAKLNGDDRPDLAPLDLLELRCAERGPWQEVER